MSILSAAVITASLIGASCTTGPQTEACTISNQDCSKLSYSILQQADLQNKEKFLELLKQCGIPTDFLNQCIIQLPSCDNTGNNGNTDCETPDDSVTPDDDETPDDSVTPDDGETPDDSVTPDDDETPDDILKPDQKPDDSGNSGNGDQTEDSENEADTSYAAQVVSLVNQERAKYNLAPLTMHTTISSAAMTRAKEITTSFSHTRPNGTSFSTVLKENGISYKGSGENIAWGQKTPQEVVTGWMNSAGHRANILNEKFTQIGIGYYVENTTPYWVQLFTY